MADPFTAVAIGASAASTGINMFAASKEADAQQSMYKYKAELARRNAQINRQNSNWTLDSGESKTQRIGQQVGFTVAKQKVAQAANGFDVNAGSNADVRDATTKIGQEDQATVRTETSRKALAYRQKADDNEAEALMDDQAGRNAQQAGALKMFSTLLGGASSVAGKWSKMGDAFGSGTGSGVTLYNSDFEASGWVA